MCVYKLVRVDINFMGYKDKLEEFCLMVSSNSFIMLILFYIHSLFQSLRELFADFNRQLVCWVDEWLELTSSELINYDNQLKNAFENVFF